MADKIIALACSAGMSTSLLVSKMKKVAEEQGKDYEIFAKSTSEAESMLHATPKPDVLLLGPQVAYEKKRIGAMGAELGVPVDVINMQDYGLMRGEKVLKAAEALMGIE
ncbi:MAG: PTS sugar transporter subunit IIB [Streptococcaceae bacterium]|jgi:PTS system cellobiose-specific IIB component|nr:PTS sugar transporter subunit IIB [Streptococcaceae bacterium]